MSQPPAAHELVGCGMDVVSQPPAVQELVGGTYAGVVGVTTVVLSQPPAVQALELDCAALVVPQLPDVHGGVG